MPNQLESDGWVAKKIKSRKQPLRQSPRKSQA